MNEGETSSHNLWCGSALSQQTFGRGGRGSRPGLDVFIHALFTVKTNLIPGLRGLPSIAINSNKTSYSGRSSCLLLSPVELEIKQMDQVAVNKKWEPKLYRRRASEIKGECLYFSGWISYGYCWFKYRCVYWVGI